MLPRFSRPNLVPSQMGFTKVLDFVRISKLLAPGIHAIIGSSRANDPEDPT